jgi:hypothetical protein
MGSFFSGLTEEESAHFVESVIFDLGVDDGGFNGVGFSDEDLLDLALHGPDEAGVVDETEDGIPEGVLVVEFLGSPLF